MQTALSASIGDYRLISLDSRHEPKAYSIVKYLTTSVEAPATSTPNAQMSTNLNATVLCHG